MNQKVITKIGVLFLVLFCVGGSWSGSSTRIMNRPLVLEDARTLYVGGSGPGNYSKIQDAVDNASVGDTVFVYDDSAPYYENIAIRTSIQLLGEDRNTTSIEGGNYAVSIYADGVTVSGFRISNVGDFWNCCGFYVVSNGNTIANNNIVNNLRMNGVYLYGASYNTIVGNHIENNNYHGIRVEYTTHNVIANNTIVNVRGFGIDLAESTDTLVYGNTAQQCFWGGMVLDNTSTSNTFYHNNFINNSQNGLDPAGGNVWDNGSAGNYWDDYQGVDANGDGIGDTPYPIPGNHSSDVYPLMKPFGFLEPNLTITVKGGFGVTISIKNNGPDVLDVDWSVGLVGGVLLLPQQRMYQGTIPVLSAGQNLVLQHVKVLFGVGRLDINVTAGSTIMMKQGVVVLFFYLPLPGR